MSPGWVDSHGPHTVYVTYPLIGQECLQNVKSPPIFVLCFLKEKF